MDPTTSPPDLREVAKQKPLHRAHEDKQRDLGLLCNDDPQIIPHRLYEPFERTDRKPGRHVERVVEDGPQRRVIRASPADFLELGTADTKVVVGIVPVDRAAEK